MENEEDPVKRQQILDARARNISHNVRCLECGSQSIEESQADIAVLLRKKLQEARKILPIVSLATGVNLIRDEIRSGKSDKDIYKKLEDDYGETILYAPKFDWQTAAFWLSPLLIAGTAGGIWAYGRHRQRTNVHLLALNLTRGVPLTSKEKETMLDILTPPPSGILPTSPWWKNWLPQ